MPCVAGTWWTAAGSSSGRSTWASTAGICSARAIPASSLGLSTTRVSSAVSAGPRGAGPWAVGSGARVAAPAQVSGSHLPSSRRAAFAFEALRPGRIQVALPAS